MNRVYNFGAGPAILPVEVLEEAAGGVLEFGESGMSILEVSHRSKLYEKVHFGAQQDILTLLGLSADEYSVLFVQGGASMQFAMIPMNFLADGQVGEYVNGGEWGTKALKEAKRVGRGEAHEIASSADKKFSYVPKGYSVDPSARYLHITTNNTIEGTEVFDLPDHGNVPLVADSSSDFMALQRNYADFSMIYAGAQKNAGPAGVAVVVVRKSFLETAGKNVPTILSYRTYAEKDSLFNTPPCFAIYVVGLVAKWALAKGGLAGVEAANRKKAELLYDTLDKLDGFYQPTVTNKADRSIMNVTFRLQPAYAALEKELLAEVKANGMDGLAGHRSVGGLRASIYNAFPYEGIVALTGVLRSFAAKHG
jgi:phosphoserine aminotransferase